MQERQGHNRNSREKKKKRYSIAALFLMLVVIALLGRSTWGAYEKNQISATARRAAEADLAELEARKQAMEQSIKAFQSEGGIEKAIRQKFQVVKPGEEMIVVVPEKPPK